MTPQTLSARLLGRERAKAAAEISTEIDEIKVALRTGFAELVAHAADRLGVQADGKKVTFRDSLVTKMEEFFGYFQARNLVGDDELAALVERTRESMKGVTAQTLRTDDVTRASVKDTLEQVKAEMDANLMVRPSRRLILDREEAKP
jgi:phage gp36-like protein